MRVFEAFLLASFIATAASSDEKYEVTSELVPTTSELIPTTSESIPTTSGLIPTDMSSNSIADMSSPACGNCKMRVFYEFFDMKMKSTELNEAFNILCEKIKDQSKQTACKKALHMKTKSFFDAYVCILRNYCESFYFCSPCDQDAVDFDTPHENLFSVFENISKHLNKPSDKRSKSTVTHVCEDCKIAMNSIRQDVNTSVIPEIIAENKLFCEEIEDKERQDNCKKKVDELVANKSVSVMEFLDPKSFCDTHHFCDLCDHDHDENTQCKLCKQHVKSIDEHVKNGKSKVEIRHELSETCDALTLKKSKCQKFVSTYSDKLVDSLLRGIETGRICAQLSFCVIGDKNDDKQSNSH